MNTDEPNIAAPIPSATAQWRELGKKDVLRAGDEVANTYQENWSPIRSDMIGMSVADLIARYRRPLAATLAPSGPILKGETQCNKSESKTITAAAVAGVDSEGNQQRKDGDEVCAQTTSPLPKTETASPETTPVSPEHEKSASNAAQLSNPTGAASCPTCGQDVAGLSDAEYMHSSDDVWAQVDREEQRLRRLSGEISTPSPRAATAAGETEAVEKAAKIIMEYCGRIRGDGSYPDPDAKRIVQHAIDEAKAQPVDAGTEDGAIVDWIEKTMPKIERLGQTYSVNGRWHNTLRDAFKDAMVRNARKGAL